VRQARCEWIYRLAQEPRRLAHRYLVGNPVFLARIASRKTDGWRGGDERGL
jgi:UDP-N-acetyl-D-mannosaminuronic acid transferase (WecB/TagA/CpsF family)